MEFIRVGEYVRIDNDFRIIAIGIGKVVRINKDDDVYVKMNLDLPILCSKEDISKHSKNIIDLIKVKDSIEYIEQTEGRDGTTLGETYEQRITSQAELEEVRKSIRDGGIKLVSVLTYEQFNGSTYKVGE